MFVCTFTQTVYGHTGTELPPPATGSQTYSYLSEEGEDLAAFKARMQAIGMEQRAKADAAPVKPYSIRDGWSWSFSEVRSIPD